MASDHGRQATGRASGEREAAARAATIPTLWGIDGRLVLAIFALAASLLFAVLAGISSASKGGGSLQIAVENCPPGTEPGDPECEEENTQVQEQGSGGNQGSGSRPGGGGGGGGGEVHDVQLGSGKRSSSGGGSESVSIKLGGKKKGGAEQELAPEETGGAEAKRKKGKQVGAPDAGDDGGWPKVSTQGGITGVGMDFISTDEAVSSFSIPPALLPIYISAGRAYGVPWNVLASINKIESDFCRLSSLVSYAGAIGCMQFLPSTWDAYGVDASGDGYADPYNPVDSIYGAARYLAASGAETDLRKAIFAYNHADWYVDQVLATAGIYGSLPPGLVAETGSLAFGHFPARGKVSYGDDFRDAQREGRKPRGLRFVPEGERAAAVATQNVTVHRVLLDRRLAKAFRAGKAELPGGQAAANGEAEAGSELGDLAAAAIGPLARTASIADLFTSWRLKRIVADATLRLTGTAPAEQTPRRAKAKGPNHGLPAGYALASKSGVGVEVEDGLGNRYRYEGLRALRDAIRPGARLRGADPIGPLPRAGKGSMLFAVRGSGGGAVDPRPLVDGYRLQEAAGYYHAVDPLGRNPFLPDESFVARVSGTIEGNDRQLARQVLSDSGISVHACGRDDIATGRIDRRVLISMLVLRKAGLTMTVTSLRCGRETTLTSSGNISAHSVGAAVDIAAFNGQPVIGNQGPGSYTEQAVKLLMGLDEEIRPNQLISLMDFGGPTFAMADHADHLHVGFNFDASLVGRGNGTLGPISLDAATTVGGKATSAQRRQLAQRFGKIEIPEHGKKPSPASVQVKSESETPEDAEAAERAAKRRRPFDLLPTGSGAQTVDVAIPAEARGDEAYAVGVVDGSTHDWDREQTVVLAHRGGTWRLVGPPRNRKGEVANPKLEALDVGADGRGYAVGRRGAVVALRGDERPRLLPSPAEARLHDVATGAGGRTAYAVGDDGTALRISGRRVERERLGDSKADLAAATIAGGRVVAAGTQGEGEPVIFERELGGGGWSEAGPGFSLSGDTGLRLTSIAAAGDELWVGGGIADTRTVGTPGELPFAAHRDGGSWTTYCSSAPALANIAELGESSGNGRPCDELLALDPSERGAVTGVAIAEQGALVATRRGLHLKRDSQGSFRPVSVTPLDVSSMALDADGTGWTVGSGRMTRIASEGGSESADRKVGASLSTELPLPGSGLPAAVAVAPGGDRGLALGGGGAATYEDGEWERAGTTGLSVRDAALVGDQALAIDDTGAVLSYRDGEWSAAGEDAVQRRVREALADVVGGQPLLPDEEGEERPAPGLHALGVGSELEAYAVGAEGRIERYLVGTWKTESSPTTATLRDVAAGTEDAVAVGDRGTLLERSDGSWRRAWGVSSLVDGQDFSAVAALADGGYVAVAGGALIERNGDGWQSAAVPPLGTPIAEIAAYRDSDRKLHVVALAGVGRAPVLLHGTADGWRPIELGESTVVGGFAPEPGAEAIWAVGTRDGGRPVAMRLELGGETKEER